MGSGADETTTIDLSQTFWYFKVQQINESCKASHRGIRHAHPLVCWRDDQKTLGPFTSEQMKRLAATGKLLPTDGVRRERKHKALLAGRIKGLFPLVTYPGDAKAP